MQFPSGEIGTPKNGLGWGLGWGGSERGPPFVSTYLGCCYYGCSERKSSSEFFLGKVL